MVNVFNYYAMFLYITEDISFVGYSGRVTKNVDTFGHFFLSFSPQLPRCQLIANGQFFILGFNLYLLMCNTHKRIHVCMCINAINFLLIGH